jgi:hypothetical protein
MPYLVKAVTTSGIVTWLTPPGAGDCRSLAIRSGADVFPTLEDATAVIAKMPWVFTAAGIRFSDVEMDEEDVAAPARDSVVTGRIPSMGLGRDRLRGKRCHPAQT